MAITLRPETLRLVASHLGPMVALIETYGAALEKSRRMGHPVRFVVNMEPQGNPRLRSKGRRRPP